MKSENEKRIGKGPGRNVSGGKSSEATAVSAIPNDKKNKKHNSALAAAAVYRSPAGAVSSNSFAAGEDNTGINTEYREEGGIA